MHSTVFLIYRLSPSILHQQSLASKPSVALIGLRRRSIPSDALICIEIRAPQYWHFFSLITVSSLLFYRDNQFERKIVYIDNVSTFFSLLFGRIVGFFSTTFGFVGVYYKSKIQGSLGMLDRLNGWKTRRGVC